MFTNMNDLVYAMEDGIVEFDFYKQDGTLRHARGTLNRYEIAKALNCAPTCEVAPNVNGDYINYFDLDKKQTRTFCCENVILEGKETNPIIKTKKH